MGVHYDKVKNFELSLHIHSYKQFSKQLAIFEEMMETYLEPLDEITDGWQHKEEKSASMLLLARLFNDFESSRILLLNGLPEQAIMPMRDIIECMMLFRLFGSDSKLALRWMDNLKEYQPSNVKKRLDELEIDCPEYAFYGMLSELAHPNLLSAVHKVTEKMLAGNILLQDYHFGGMNNPTWIELSFNNLLVFMLLTMMSVLPPANFPLLKNPNEWWNEVLGLKDKIIELGVDFKIEADEKTGQDKVKQEQIYKKMRISHIKSQLWDMEKISTDNGFSDMGS